MAAPSFAGSRAARLRPRLRRDPAAITRIHILCSAAPQIHVRRCCLRSAAPTLGPTPWSLSRSPFPLSAIFSSPADVVAFEDEDDGGGCVLRIGGFHHYPQVGTGARASTSACPRSSELHQAGTHPPIHPDAGCVDLIPLRQQIKGRLDWETGEMEANFNAEQRAKEVAVLYMVPGELEGQLHTKKMGYHDEMVLLCPQGAADVVVLAARLQ